MECQSISPCLTYENALEPDAPHKNVKKPQSGHSGHSEMALTLCLLLGPFFGNESVVQTF